jgi:hypothetical protein
MKTMKNKQTKKGNLASSRVGISTSNSSLIYYSRAWICIEEWNRV